MDSRDLKEVDTLLGIVGKTSLFEYYEVDPHAEDDVLDQAIKKRRTWAQGQQANPKFKNEALWLIKHNALVRRVLVDHRGEYLSEVENRVQEAALKELSKFIQGALATGKKLTPESEEALHRQGQTLGLTEDAVSRKIDEMLDQTGISRDNSSDDEAPLPPLKATTTEGGFQDFYGILGVAPNASMDAIELAHREKYREARNMRDKDRASDRYKLLDDAWRVLHDATRRAEYDVEYRNRTGGSAAKAEEVQYYLPPPTTGAAPPPTPPSIETPPPPRPPVIDTASAPRSLVMPIPVPTSDPDAPPPRPGTAPPKPPTGISKTIGISGQSGRRPRPRLSIASPDLVVIKVGRKPVAHSFVVKNSGQGKMPGRVTSDREWVQVTRTRLDQDAAQQEVEVIIHPRSMPRNTGVALVTVVTDHGERRAITLRVERTSVPLPYVAGATVLVIVLAAIFATVFSMVGRGSSTPTPEGTALEIVVDPTSDAVRVNERAVGNGEFVRVVEDLETDTEITVSAVLDGFEMAQETVSVAPGETKKVNLSLKLRETLAMPATTLTEGKVNSELAAKAIETRKKGINGCFQTALSGRPGMEARVNADIYFNSLGGLIYLDLRDANFDKGLVEPCLQRQLRAVKFPTLDGGDYGVVRGRTFSATVTSGSG